MLSRDSVSFPHRLFRFSLGLKALDGILEIAGGILLSLVHRREINRLVIVLTQHELIEDPKDFVANHLRTFIVHLSSDIKLFAVAYLIVHGIIKVTLAVSLLKGRPWVYPSAMGFFGVFMVYEAYCLSQTHSLFMACFFLLDLAIVSLLHWEHGRRVHSI